MKKQHQAAEVEAPHGKCDESYSFFEKNAMGGGGGDASSSSSSSSSSAAAAAAAESGAGGGGAAASSSSGAGGAGGKSTSKLRALPASESRQVQRKKQKDAQKTMTMTMQATLVRGNDVRSLVKLPQGEDLHEWLAVNAVHFFSAADRVGTGWVPA